MNRWPINLTIALAVAVLVIPVLADLAIDDRRVFGYLAPDVFYYLTIARNAHEVGLLSFDGEHGTNGYHPLWQWLLCPLYAVIEQLGAGDSLLQILVLISVALIAVALVLLGRMMARGGRLTPWFVLLVPGVAALISTPLYQASADRVPFQDPASARPIFTTLWSYANGMETPLLLVTFAATALFVIKRERWSGYRDALVFALLLSLLTFSRLDHVFFAGAMWMTVAGWAWRDGDVQRLRHVLAAGVAFALAVLLYMLGNQLVYGTPMPVSGGFKSSFPRISTSTLRRLWTLLSDTPEQWMSGATRLYQLLFPMLVAAIYLPLNLRLSSDAGGSSPLQLPRWLPRIALRPGRDRIDAMLCWTAAAVLVLGTYNTLFVLLVHTGPWYFPISALFVSLAFVTSLERVLDQRRLLGSTRARALVLAGVTVVSAAYFFRAHHRSSYLADQAQFYYDEAPAIRAYFGDAPPKLVEFDDGIVTFATHFPALSGFGLALDHEAIEAKRRGELMTLALARGHGHVASSHYVQFYQSDPPTSEQARKRYKWISKAERERFDFEVEYHSPASGFTIFKLVAKDDSP